MGSEPQREITQSRNACTAFQPFVLARLWVRHYARRQMKPHQARDVVLSRAGE